MNYPILLYRGEQFNASFYYFAKCDIDHAFLLVTKTGKTLFVPKLNESFAKENFEDAVVTYADPLQSLKKEIKSKRIFVDGNAVSMRLFQKLSEICKPTDCSEELSELRAVKREEEITKISKAVRITKKIFDSIDFSKMLTEEDIKAHLLKETIGFGCESAFEPIVATDRNSSFPHYRAGTAKIGDFVLVDYGVRYDYYCADLTRCFFIRDSKKNKEREEKYLLLTEITKKIIERIGGFKTGSEVAKYSTQLIKEYGLPEMIHSIGHGIGLEVHESPRLGLKSKDKIAKNALAIEPAVYFKDYGLRYEENVYFDGKKARIL